MSHASWFVVPRPAPAAALRLFCFPHAGGAASTFAGWAIEGVEVVAVQPPGRERRLAEPPLDRLLPLVEDVGEAIAAEPERPYAFFGHSTGALVAYELTRWLAERGRALPIHLVVSGRWPPHRTDPEPPIHALPAPQLIAALRRYGGTPDEVLGDAELMEFFLPLLRADFAVGDTYQHRPGAPLPVPITALGGDGDPRVPADSLAEWGRHTTAAFAMHLLPGGHFYLVDQRPAVLRIVAATLAPVLLAR